MPFPFCFIKRTAKAYLQMYKKIGSRQKGKSRMEFYNTRMGQEYYQYHFPQLVKQVSRVAAALEKKEAEVASKTDAVKVDAYQFHKLLENECEKRWNEEKKDSEGIWEEQAEEIRVDFYNQLYHNIVR